MKKLQNNFYENLTVLFHHVQKNGVFATTAAVAKSIKSS